MAGVRRLEVELQELFLVSYRPIRSWEATVSDGGACLCAPDCVEVNLFPHQRRRCFAVAERVWIASQSQPPGSGGQAVELLVWRPRGVVALIGELPVEIIPPALGPGEVGQPRHIERDVLPAVDDRPVIDPLHGREECLAAELVLAGSVCRVLRTGGEEHGVPIAVRSADEVGVAGGQYRV